jgi:Excalibur calcium-binding domain
MRKATSLLAAVTAACGLLLPATDAQAVVIRHFTNCTALNHRYPHGVGRRDAHDHTSGTPVTNFFRNNRLYAVNADHDRDHDHIACER